MEAKPFCGDHHHLSTESDYDLFASSFQASRRIFFCYAMDELSGWSIVADSVVQRKYIRETRWSSSTYLALCHGLRLRRVACTPRHTVQFHMLNRGPTLWLVKNVIISKPHVAVPTPSKHTTDALSTSAHVATSCHDSKILDRVTYQKLACGIKELSFKSLAERLGTCRDRARVMAHFFRTRGTVTDVDESTVDAATDACRTLLVVGGSERRLGFCHAKAQTPKFWYHDARTLALVQMARVLTGCHWI